MTERLIDLPLWAAIPVCLLMLAGAGFSLAGAIGLVRMGSFYQRLHTPSLASSGGTILITAASILCFAVLDSRWVIHEVLIIAFVLLTTPVSLMLIGQSTLYRDRIAGKPTVPKKAPGEVE